MKRCAIIALVCVLIIAIGQGYSADSLHTLMTLGPLPGPDYLGPSISGAGDVNADGLADFLVGNAYEHECYIYHGKAQLDTVPDIIIPCPETYPDDVFNDFGGRVAGGRDVNGDGFDDILITNYEWCYTTGKVYLYYGGPSMDVEADIALASIYSSWMTYFWFKDIHGSLIGDLNGDGFDELAIRVWEPGDAGAYVYFGGAPMDSIHDLGLRGDQDPNVYAGAYIADGDVNGDGWLDVALSVLGYHEPEGEVEGGWVYYGGPPLDSIPDVNLSIPDLAGFCRVCIPGDMNGDGYDDIVLAHHYHYGPDDYAKCMVYFGGGQMDGEYDMRFSGKVFWGIPSLAGGDLNNDGYADLIFGEVLGQVSENEGRLAVYFGGAVMDTIPDIEIHANDQRLGQEVAWIGDMTGDGWAEFAVSNPSGSGEIYIYTMGEVSVDGPKPGALTPGELRIVPNPARGMTLIGLDQDSADSPEVRIYDLVGHLVRRLGSAQQDAGRHWVLWDGTNSFGGAVPLGTYLVRARNGNDLYTKRIVIAR